MAFLIDEDTRVVVQGLTGSSGRMGAEMMRAGGATIVAGVTPGKGGQEVEGIPVFDTVQEARDVPMVVRIVGTNADEAATLLREAAFETAASLDEAAAKAVAAARGAAA